MSPLSRKAKAQTKVQSASLIGKKSYRVAVLCGGPSPERGISLNSARSLADHLESCGVEVVPYYFDYQKKAYRIERAHLYSNTPSDFDFKLKSIATQLTEKQLIAELKKVNIVFPAIHGKFGEDGEIQRLLERNHIPFVGSGSKACDSAFDKYTSSVALHNFGFDAVPTLLIEKGTLNHRAIKDFFSKHVSAKAIVKPARSGSSIGVTQVSSVAEVSDACEQLWEKNIDDRLVLQPFVEGIEFTVIVFENRVGLPVALFPTEIQVDYKKNEIFDYRKKYLPTRDRTYFCPPRFEDLYIHNIRTQAQQLFKMFGMHDYARFDGWILEDGKIVFTDFNPVSGMEQNSFLFQQAGQVGMSHRDTVRYLLARACTRLGIDAPKQQQDASPAKSKKRTKKMAILFGGGTAERQVSVMSGTNAWLKLRDNDTYETIPCVLEMNNSTVWRVPYYIALNHTVEEIIESSRRAVAQRDRIHHLLERVLTDLALSEGDATEAVFVPYTEPLIKLLNEVDFVFLGLHGGIGEDGTVQKMLERKKLPFNGPGSVASKICMDKFETGKLLMGMEKGGIFVAPKKLVAVAELQKLFKTEKLAPWWKSLLAEFKSDSIIVKPHADGCSAGVVRLKSVRDVLAYLKAVTTGVPLIPQDTFELQSNAVEMPSIKMNELLFEKWIETDKIVAEKNSLLWKATTNFIEVTVGVIGHTGSLHVLSPSLTVARSGVLSLEEKFQGGTGVNITPPPAPYVKPSAVVAAKKRIAQVCEKLGIEGYSRLDAFMHTQTGEVIIIEVNTLPALTPSTVLYHQGLAEKPPLFPRELLAHLVSLGQTRY